MMRPHRAMAACRHAAALAAVGIALVATAAAQTARPLPAPMSPSSAPPPSPQLAARPQPSPVPVIPALSLSADFAVLADGGWRLSGGVGRGEPDHDSRVAVETIGRYLAATAGRVTVQAQVSGPANDPSVARRASLARAIAIKAALERAGVPGTRIDLRPMGRTEEARDGIDILAPSPPRRVAQRSTP